jgi:predicted metal-dependent peptidase
MRGYIKGALADMIEARLKERSVPFERIVRAFVGGHLKIGHKSTPMRPSRRRHIPPGHTFARGLDILYACDDSGSMANEEVALGRSEMHHLTMISGVRVRFQRFCCGLVGELVDLDQADFSTVLQRGNGGTDFNAIIDLAHEIKPDLLLIMTDGQAPTPERRPPCPVGWILTHDGTSHPWGTLIRLPTVEDIRRGYRAVIERWAPNK